MSSFRERKPGKQCQDNSAEGNRPRESGFLQMISSGRFNLQSDVGVLSSSSGNKTRRRVVDYL